VGPDRYTELDIDLWLGSRIHKIDIHRHGIELADEKFIWADTILLATGASPRRLHIRGADLAGVLVLRTFNDAVLMSNHLVGSEPIIVVGAGFIGLEVAALARSVGVDVTVIEPTKAPLAPVLGTELAARVLRMHRDHGVRIVTGVSVAEFLGRRSIEAAVLSDGTCLPCGAAIIGIGVVPADHLAQDAGILCDRGIMVDRFGRTNVSWVYAAGDVANQPHPSLPVPGRIEHWDTAQRHGRAVAATMAGRPTALQSTPYFWSQQFGSNVQMYGRPAPGDEFVMQRSGSDEKPLGFWTRGGVLTAAAGIDRPKELRVAKALIEAKLRPPAEVLADPATDLRGLLRGHMPLSGPLTGDRR
jgi:3-phenylpropionate/trans-cinnamate dioxygenase ferredoxin reductase component